MFAAISRRLAIMNALVVILVIAAVGLASYLYLARKIETQTDAELRSRSASAVELWTNTYLEADAGGPAGSPAPASQNGATNGDGDHGDDDHHDDENKHQAEELIRSGDTIAYGIDIYGDVIASLRPVQIEDLPNEDSIDRALLGSIVVETMTIEHERVRVRTEPVLGDGRIIGAIQVGMGLGPNERVLDFVQWATIGGVVLGALLALPAGILLANRSMRPIRESFARQRAFVADAAHELRTPLTLIRAEAEYMTRTPELSAGDREESESAIVREVDSMAALVSSLLQLARMDERGQKLEGQRVDLADISRTVAERFQGLAAERQITLVVNGTESVFARGDRAAAEQVLAILLDNAIAFTPKGGNVRVEAGVRSGKATIAVVDTGIGISEENQKRIFDRFYRADAARSRSSGGAGLGLSIATELMAAQDGRIEVESDLGAGSTFMLIFETA